jgi:hypothetical protein
MCTNALSPLPSGETCRPWKCRFVGSRRRLCSATESASAGLMRHTSGIYGSLYRIPTNGSEPMIGRPRQPRARGSEERGKRAFRNRSRARPATARRQCAHCEVSSQAQVMSCAQRALQPVVVQKRFVLAEQIVSGQLSVLPRVRRRQRPAMSCSP